MKLIVLDRDGVINLDSEQFIKKPEEWKPIPGSLEAIARLNESETRQRLINASDAQQWSTVLRLATETPGVLTCSNVDILWRVAEAFSKTNQLPRALDAYTYVLTNCNDPSERLATMQKAIDVLPEAEIPPLLVYERDGEFAAVMDTMLRRRVGITAENPDLSSTPEDLARIEALAGDETNAADALLLGMEFCIVDLLLQS